MGRILVPVALALLVFAPAAGASPAPPGFFGVVPQTRLDANDLSRIGKAGLTVRQFVPWSGVEPQPGVYDFAELDRLFGAAAEHGVRVLPIVGESPAWATAAPWRPPLSGTGIAAWDGFLSRLAERYGPGGEFWLGRRDRMPVHRWQIWNEPNFRIFWLPKPSPRGYARLLHASARTLRAVDPRAQIVAAAVAPIEDAIRPWEFLRRLYAVPGARKDFDIAALHPYSSSIAGLTYEVERTRAVMAAAGLGRKPLLITEFGVASDGEVPSLMNQGPEGQAQFLWKAYERLLQQRRRWRIAGAYWFTWKDERAPVPNCSFCEFAGLFDAAGEPKPAWRALRQLASRQVPA